MLSPVTKSVHYFVIETFYIAFKASEIIYAGLIGREEWELKKQCVEWKEKYNNLEQVLDIYGKEPVADSQAQYRGKKYLKEINAILLL